MKTKRLLLIALLSAVCAMFGLFAVACADPTPPAPTYYTVTFDAQGHGTAPATLTEVEPESKITEPETLTTTEEYVFGGWYKENTCANKWNFEVDTVTSNVTLYALWTEKTYTVTFNMQGNGTAPANITGLKKGVKVTEPDDPTADGFVFEGWYKEEGCTTAWNFATDTITGDTTLYASWATVTAVSIERTEQPVDPNKPDGDKKLVFDKTNVSVNGYAYFSVPADGMYYVTIKADGDNSTSSGSDEAQPREGENANENQFYIDESTYYKQEKLQVYLIEGVHKIASMGASFNAEISLYGLDMPFTVARTYQGETYEFVVSSLGIYDGEKTGTVSVRMNNINQYNYMYLDTVAFDGTYYTLNSGNNTFRIKLTVENEDVTAIEVYTQSDEEWTKADTLEALTNAAEVAVEMTANATGVNYEEDIQKSFEYVYFDVTNLQGQWLEFSGFNPDTVFYWVGINDYSDRTGDIAEPITISEGTPVYLLNNYCNHIAVVCYGETSVSFTVKTVEAPAGLSASNPLTIEGSTYTVDNTLGGMTYYLTYNLESAGNYVVTVSTSSWGSTSYNIYYTVNETAYGYDSGNWTWVGDISSDYPYAEVSLNAGANNFTVTLGGWDSGITVTIIPASEFEYELPELVAGTYEYDDYFDGTLTLTISGNKTDGYTATLVTFDGEEISGPITEGKGVYVFKDYKLKVQAGGTIVFNYNFMDYYLTKTNSGNSGTSDADLISETYSDGEFILIIDVDTMTVTYSAGDDTYVTGATLTNTDGVYSFEYDFYGTYTVTFTVTADASGNPQLNVIDGFNPDMPYTATIYNAGNNSGLSSGRYVALTDSDMYVLNIDAEEMVVTYSVSGVAYATDATLEYDADMDNYSFTYESSNVTYYVYIAVEDDGLHVEVYAGMDSYDTEVEFIASSGR